MNIAYEPCVSEPISFLRLERYLQRDLPDAESERIDDHLRVCSVCRACLDTMQTEVIELLPLPEVAPMRSRSPWSRRVLPAGVLAAAAAALIMLARDATDHALPKGQVRIKGGELALELVREHQGAIASDASVYLAGDRFAVRVSCPAGRTMWADVVVFDDSGASFPLQPIAALRCSNGVTLPGAFELTGTTRASVCVRVAEQPIDRERVERAGPSALGHDTACTTVVPGPAQER
jgi:hypothetical protein